MGLVIKLFIEESRNELNLVVLRDAKKRDTIEDESNLVADITLSLNRNERTCFDNTTYDEERTTIVETESDWRIHALGTRETRSRESPTFEPEYTPNIPQNETLLNPIKIETLLDDQSTLNSTEENYEHRKTTQVNSATTVVAKFRDVVYEMTPVTTEVHDGEANLLHLVDQNTCQTPPIINELHDEAEIADMPCIVTAGSRMDETPENNSCEVLPLSSAANHETDHTSDVKTFAEHEKVTEITNTKASVSRLASWKRMRISDPKTDSSESEAEITATQKCLEIKSNINEKKIVSQIDIACSNNGITTSSTCQKTKESWRTNKSLICSYCRYSTTRARMLQEHERTHTGEKPFSCSYCSYRCASKPNLMRHLRKHTREKPFKCSFCSSSFSLKATLLSHEQRHTGNKPYLSNMRLQEQTQI